MRGETLSGKTYYKKGGGTHTQRKERSGSVTTRNNKYSMDGEVEVGTRLKGGGWPGGAEDIRHLESELKKE